MNKLVSSTSVLSAVGIGGVADAAADLDHQTLRFKQEVNPNRAGRICAKTDLSPWSTDLGGSQQSKEPSFKCGLSTRVEQQFTKLGDTPSAGPCEVRHPGCQCWHRRPSIADSAVDRLFQLTSAHSERGEIDDRPRHRRDADTVSHQEVRTRPLPEDVYRWSVSDDRTAGARHREFDVVTALESIQGPPSGGCPSRQRRGVTKPKCPCPDLQLPRLRRCCMTPHARHHGHPFSGRHPSPPLRGGHSRCTQLAVPNKEGIRSR